MQQNQVGREGEQSGWDLWSWESVRGKQGLHGWRFALGVSHSGTNRHPSPEVQHGEDKPPWLAGGLVGLTGGLQKAGLHSWGGHGHQPAPEARQRRWIEMAHCSRACPSLRQRLASQPALHWAGGCQGSGRGLSRETTCDSGLMWRPSRAGPAVTGSSIGGRSECSLGLWPQPDCYRPCPNSHQGPTPALLVQHCFPIGWRDGCWDGQENSLTGNGNSSDPILKASAPVTWDPSRPLTGWWWSRERQEDLAHTWLQPKPLQLKRTSYQASSCQHTLGEMWLRTTADSALLPKPLGTHWMSMRPHKEHTPSRPQWVTVSQNFRETKSERMRRQRNLSQLKEKKKTPWEKNEINHFILYQAKNSKN